MQGGNTLFSEAYVYDADANLTRITDLVNGKDNQTLGYDGLNRLTSAVAPNNWGTESFTYDPLNNIRTHVAAGLTLSFNYDGYNRLASETQGSPTGGGFANFQYDAQGNQTQSTVVFTSTPHTFDAKNQMLQIPGVATYSYDEAGRRIKKVLANGQTSYFFYSQAGQLMYEYNATAAQPTDYVYLNGKLIARYLSGQNPTDLLTDRQGTPVREVDFTGAVAQSFSYRPFGQLYSGPSQQQPGYTGHVLDPESSLNYMQQRYQDGGLGQFLSVDPVGPTPGDVLSFNRYAYAGNNPITRTDQDGRQSTYDVGAWAGVAIMAQQSPQQVQRLNGQNVAQAKIMLEVLAASAASPAVGFVAKTAIAVASDSLAAGSLTAGIMANGPAIVASGSIVAEGVAAANGAPSSPLSTEEGFALNAAQSSNLARFNKGLPSGNLGTDVDKLGGGFVFSSTVPGKVPGSSAVYQKTVDGEGITSSFLKTTFSPNGDVVHVKDKINNTTIQ